MEVSELAQNLPRVFISYSYDSSEHMEWVTKLATELEEVSGIEVIFDKWDVRLGQNLTFFMEQGLTDAHLVLCVCSDQYVTKANSRSRGVGYESSILTAQMFSNANIDHIIPIVRTNGGVNKTPIYMGGKQYIDFSDDSRYFEKYKELQARIWGEDLNRRPKRGSNPYQRKKAEEIDLAVETEKLNYKNIRKSGEVTFNYSNNNGIYTIGAGQYSFETRWSKSSDTSIYALNRGNIDKIGYKNRVTEFPCFEDIKQGDFDFNSSDRSIKLNEVVIWINKQGYFAVTKVIDIKDNRNAGDEDTVTFSYFIYEEL